MTHQTASRGTTAMRGDRGSDGEVETRRDPESLESSLDFYEATLQKPKRYQRRTLWGETKTVAEWSRDSRCPVSMMTLYMRLWDGWSDSDALTLPKGMRRKTYGNLVLARSS